MIKIDQELIAEMLMEQFIPDHLFVYLASGSLQCFDAEKNYTFKKGDYFIARKNRLARYKIASTTDEFTPILFCFDEAFLKDYQKKHPSAISAFVLRDTFIKIPQNGLIPNFVKSLKPYYKKANELEEAFEDLKYEELLLILLRADPTLTNLFFDFGTPGKIDLEEFMNRNYKFNVSIPRFAYLTGRSLSAFKRDFKQIFNETPNRWLVQKRLQEAYSLINEKNKKPSDIYIDLGFEDLSHFSFAFKKLFGCYPNS